MRISLQSLQRLVAALHVICLILFGALMLVACTGCAIGGAKGFRVVEPPVKAIDVAELSANIPPGKALLFDYRHISVSPDSATDINNSTDLTIGAFKELANFGAGLGADIGPYAVLNNAVQKNRDIGTTVIIADSADILEMRRSDNESKISPSQKTLDIDNQLVITEPQAPAPSLVIPDQEPDSVVPNPVQDLSDPSTPSDDPVLEDINQVINELDPSQAFFQSLIWLRNDPSGPNATVTKSLENVRVTGGDIFFDLENIGDWPNENSPIGPQGHGVMCGAIKRGDTWVGGKFDHLRANTAQRDTKNLCGYLDVCPQSGDTVRLWALSYDGSQASNYAELTWP